MSKDEYVVLFQPSVASVMVPDKTKTPLAVIVRKGEKVTVLGSPAPNAKSFTDTVSSKWFTTRFGKSERPIADFVATSTMFQLRTEHGLLTSEIEKRLRETGSPSKRAT